MHRRIEILRQAILQRQVGGSLSAFVSALLSPSYKVVGSSFVEKVEALGEFSKIDIKGIALPLWVHGSVEIDNIYASISEILVQTHWHNYEIQETTVSGGVVLDCGAAEGLFALQTIERADRVIILEPSPVFLKGLQKTFAKDCKATIIPAAVGASCGSAVLEMKGNESALISEGVGDIVEVTTIDYIRGSISGDIAYIKADVEGAEIEMMKGARETIYACKPKIAVAVYHDRGNCETIMKELKYVQPLYKFLWKGISSNGEPVILHAWV